MKKGLLALAIVATLAACSPKGEALYSRAEKSLSAGQYEAAVIDLKNLVKDEPGNGKARALLALALVESGDPAAAAIELEKASDLKAPADALLVPECSVPVARGEFQAALDKCKPDAAQGQAKVELQVGRGRALLALQKPEDAKPLFQAALDASNDNLDALLGLATATYSVDGLAAARGVMDKATADTRNKAAYWMTLGGINVEGGDLAAAERAYLQALEHLKSGARPGEKLMAMGALAETQMRRGNVEAATATTGEMIKAAPDNPLVQQLRGQVAAAGGHLDEARTLLEDAVAKMPENDSARVLLGVVNLQQGNFGQAEMHFQAVLARQPENARVKRLLAESRASQQTPEQSLESLQATIAAGKADPTLLAMAGRMSLASGDRQQALAYFTRAAAETSDDKSVEVQLEVASGYLMAGDLDRAVELLEKLPAEGVAGLQRDYLLMAALLRKGETEKALAEADRVVKENSDDPKARNLAAGVYVAAGNKAEARKQFNEALKLKPDDTSTLINLGRLDVLEGKVADARKHFQQVLERDPKNLLATAGMAAAAAGDAEEVEKWLRKATTDHPDSLEAQIGLVQFYLGTRDFKQALSVIDQASKKAPDAAVLSNLRGLAQMGLNDLPAALNSFKDATRKAPQAFGYAINLAKAYLANGDVQGALDVVDGLVRDNPKSAQALALGADASLQAGRVEKAAGYVERLRQLAPDAPGTFLLEGNLAMAQRRYKDALAAFRKAASNGTNSQLVLAEYRAASLAGEPNPEKGLVEWVARNPKDINAVSVVAELRKNQGNRAAAIKLYETSLAAEPENVVLLNNLAVLYDMQGDRAKAEATAQRAYKAAPKAPAIADTYGWILLKQGKVEQAGPLLQAAARGLPDNAEIQYHHAAWMARSGDKAGAVSLLKKATSGRMPPDQHAEAQKLLKQLSQ